MGWGCLPALNTRIGTGIRPRLCRISSRVARPIRPSFLLLLLRVDVKTRQNSEKLDVVVGFAPSLLTTRADSLADRGRGSLPLFASMVELVDTPDLGSGAREGLGVQVPLLV